MPVLKKLMEKRAFLGDSAQFSADNMIEAAREAMVECEKIAEAAQPPTGFSKEAAIRREGFMQARHQIAAEIRAHILREMA